MPMPKRTPLRGSAVLEMVSIDSCATTGSWTLSMRSIFCERSKPRYRALQSAAGAVAAVASHGPSATEEFLKLPPASEKNPTVFRPPSSSPLPVTIAPLPLSAAGSNFSRTGPPLLLDMSELKTKYGAGPPAAAIAAFIAAASTTACVGFLASTLHVAAFSLNAPVTGSLSTRQRPLPLASQKCPPSAESSQTPLNGNVTPATNGEPVAACAAGTPVTSTDATIATTAA